MGHFGKRLAHVSSTGTKEAHCSKDMGVKAERQIFAPLSTFIYIYLIHHLAWRSGPKTSERQICAMLGVVQVAGYHCF